MAEWSGAGLAILDTPVRSRSPPPVQCGGGETGSRARFGIGWSAPVKVNTPCGFKSRPPHHFLEDYQVFISNAIALGGTPLKAFGPSKRRLHFLQGFPDGFSPIP